MGRGWGGGWAAVQGTAIYSLLLQAKELSQVDIEKTESSLAKEKLSRSRVIV